MHVIQNNMKIFLKLLVSILLPFLAGFIGSVFTTPNIPTWYASLNKPILNPPNWIFGPVWTILYILMGISAFLIWNYGLSKRDVKKALTIFIFQLFLNSIWSIFFFGFQSPLLAFFVIVILFLLILLMIFSFYKISKTAGMILLPYLFWVGFASYLNLAILILN